ncbi:MAG: HAD family hydrolase [Anaerolineae bacterium]|nr:HAD family hydrolase [Anaerolineae bacterium]
MTTTWILDFDETLVRAGISWALDDAFPALIREHGLPFDPARFDQLVLEAQERGSLEADPRPIVHSLFEGMGWPTALGNELLHSLMTKYEPQVFEDAWIFLDRLNAAGDRAVVISNNPRSPALAQSLGLAGHVAHILTQGMCPGSLPKPDRSLWDYLQAQSGPPTPGDNVIIVGDDPWSDGVFAENCGLPCYIVDRRGRFRSLCGAKGYRWVRSLLDIPLGGA